MEENCTRELCERVLVDDMFLVMTGGSVSLDLFFIHGEETLQPSSSIVPSLIYLGNPVDLQGDEVLWSQT